ncbi:MAG: 16S rRNA (guanine(527)-N(7))-methyltransferase RsmG, partial [Thermoanaerobaculia bacterium]
LSNRVARPAAASLEQFFKAFPTLLGRAATPAERNAFGRYANLLVLWNRVHHLTALKTRAEIGRGLFLDSLLFGAVLPRGSLRVLDMGAGAGIPGVPLRMVESGLLLTLIESRRKPVSFLRALIRELAMPDITVHHGRAEDVSLEVPELAAVFDVVLTRAVGRSAHQIEMAMAYLRPGGRLVASGPPVGSAMPKVDWEGLVEWKTVEFPKMGLSRVFLVVTKED